MITMVGNLKGGSGKSTVAFNLAVWLIAHGRETSVFDIDPQRTLSDVADIRQEEAIEPFFDVEHKGSRFAEKLQNRSGEVLIDVGSADMPAMRSAMAVADRIVVPVPPSQADIWSTQRFLALAAEHVRRDADICVFVNRADTHRAVRESDEAEAALASLPGARLVDHRLHQRTAYRRSFSEGLGVFELEPRGKAAKEFRALAETLYPENA